MSEIILQADDLAELRAKLVELDIDVPARSEGRRNQHAERYCIAHLLATLPAERLSFPLTLVHSDKPDFVLTMSGSEIGIEHTEAVPENVARANFLREKGLGPDVYFTQGSRSYAFIINRRRHPHQAARSPAVLPETHRMSPPAAAWS